MGDRPVTGVIPQNVSYSDGIFSGLITMRKIIEMGAGLIISFFIYLILSMVAPETIAMTIGLALGIILVIVGLFGVNGEPFTTFIYNIINYRNNKGIILIPLPMPFEYQEENSQTKGEVSKVEELLMRVKNEL